VTSIRPLVLAGAVIGCRAARPPVAARPAAPAIVADGRLLAYQGSDSESTALVYGRFDVDVSVHGHTLRMIADHGSGGSMSTDAAVDRLQLHHWYDGASRIDTLVRHGGTEMSPDSTAEMTTTRGDTVFEYWGIPEPQSIDSIRLGTSRQDSVLFPLEVPSAGLAPFDGLIGREILSQFDLFFDMPAGRLRLFERSPAGVPGQPPTWLPDGITRRDCIPAHVLRHTMDTTGIGEDERRELQRNPAKRFWDQEEIKLPIVIDGRPIDGMFDSGAGHTTMNWALARAIGITRESPRVQAYMAGGSRLITINPRPTHSPSDSTSAGYADSSFVVTGLVLQLGRTRLAADTVLISDPDFADFPNAATEPLINVGLRHVREVKLFFSYSTGFVCLARGTA